MAKLPDKHSLGQVTPQRVGRRIIGASAPARLDTSARREATAELATGIKVVGNVALQLAEREIKREEFETERRYQEFKFNEKSLLVEAQRNVGPNELNGFAQGISDGYQKRAGPFYDSIPKRQKAVYHEKLLGNERNNYGTALKFQFETQKYFSEAVIMDSVIKYAEQTANGPLSEFDANKFELDNLIELEPYHNAVERDEIKRETDRTLALNWIASRPASEVGELMRMKAKDRPEAFNRLTEKDWKEVRKSLTSELKDDIKDITTAKGAGFNVDPNLVQRAINKAEALGDRKIATKLAVTLASANVQSSLRRLPPADARDFLNNLISEASEGGFTAAEATVIKDAKATVKNMASRLKTDSLSFVVETGRYTVPPLDITTATPEQYKERRKLSGRIAEEYDIDPHFFTAEQRAENARKLESAEPDEQLEIIKKMAAGFKGDAPRAISELSESNPTMAYIASLAALDKGLEPVALEALRGLRLIKDKVVNVTKIDSAAAIGNAIGNAYGSRLGGTNKQVVDTGEAIYASRAAARGIVVFNEDLYEDALNEAAGFNPKTSKGGIGEFNARKIPLPFDMDENEFGFTVKNLQPSHLTSLSRTGGKPIHRSIRGIVMDAKAEEFHDAYYVAAGHGKYFVSMTDPNVSEQFLIDDLTKDLYVLDLSDASNRPPSTGFFENIAASFEQQIPATEFPPEEESIFDVEFPDETPKVPKK